MKSITVGGGCFWCMEAVFLRIDGVISVLPGYAGGHTKDPTYNDVCSGNTGHAEVVQIEYDESRVELSQLLNIFFLAHDATTKDRQGADIGSQYRSIILYTDEFQKQQATQAIERAQKQLTAPVVTEVTALKIFHPAESYHHKYYDNNLQNPYCGVVIFPKLKKLGL